MSNLDDQPQLTREQIIAHCRKWVDAWNYGDGSIDQILLDNYIEATIETDVLTYPLETQKWITEESEPELWDIIMTADEVDHNHSNPQVWVKLVRKVEAVTTADQG